MIVTQKVGPTALALVYHSAVTQPVPGYAQTQEGLFPGPHIYDALTIRPVVNPTRGYLGQINEHQPPAPLLSPGSAVPGTGFVPLAGVPHA